MGWMSDAVDFVTGGSGSSGSSSGGSSWVGSIGSGLGAAWDWATGTEAGMGAIGGAATAGLNYMAQGDDPTKMTLKSTEQQIKAHNAGISKAALKYQPKKGGMLSGSA